MSNHQRGDDDAGEYMEEDVDDHEMQDVENDDMDDEFRRGDGASDSDVEEFDYSV